MKKITIFILATFMVSQAHAVGSIISGKVTSIRVDADGRAMIHFDQLVVGNPPACVALENKDAFGIDASTTGGQAVLSMALTAKTTGSVITAFGKGVCGIYGGAIVETWDYGTMN